MKKKKKIALLQMSDNPVFDSIYNRTLRFLSFRPRSEKEVLDYLKKKNAGSKNTTEIIQRLKEYKFIDDLEFARWYMENRKKGMRLVSMELTQKGITKEIIEEAMLDFDVQKKDHDLLFKLLEKKWKTVSKSPKEKQFEKLMRFLMRKGLGYEESRKEVSKLIKQDLFDE